MSIDNAKIRKIILVEHEGLRISIRAIEELLDWSMAARRLAGCCSSSPPCCNVRRHRTRRADPFWHRRLGYRLGGDVGSKLQRAW
jgi:hypothetical protein